MATTITGHQSSNDSVITTDVVDRTVQPVAGTAETFTLAAAASKMGFEAVENGALTIRLQTPATDPATDWAALFGVAEAVNRLQAVPNTVVTVTIDDGTNSGTFSGDGFSVEARGDSTVTWQSDSGIHFPEWMSALNALVDADANAYVLSALPLVGTDIGDNPEITFTVTPYVAQTITAEVTAVQDPDVLDELRTGNELSRQALDVASQDDRAASGMVAAEIANTDAAAQDVDLGRVLAKDGTYTLPAGVTVAVTGQFSIDNATSMSGSVLNGDVWLSLDGNETTPVFVRQPNLITAFGNEDSIRLQFREQKPLLRLSPGAVVIVAGTARS